MSSQNSVLQIAEDLQVFESFSSHEVNHGINAGSSVCSHSLSRSTPALAINFLQVIARTSCILFRLLKGFFVFRQIHHRVPFKDAVLLKITEWQ